MSDVVHVLITSSNPTQKPNRIGQHWVNKLNKRTWYSVGADSVADWIESDLVGHLAAVDPHPQYETAPEVQAKVDLHANRTDNPHSVTKAQVELGSADNTSDVDKPVSTAQQAALDLKINLTEKGVANGVVPLNALTKIDSVFLPSFVDDVIESADFASLPVTGETGKIYVTLDNNKTYRWSGSVYVEISASPGSTDAVPEGVVNLYFTTARVLATALTGLNTGLTGLITASDTVLQAFGRLQNQISANLTTLSNHIANISNPHSVTKTQVGLSNVPNVDTTTSTNVNEGTNLYFTTARVLATALTGYSVGSNTILAAADTILQAFQKVQGQINARALAARQILNGYGITGGGDFTADRTLAVNLSVVSSESATAQNSSGAVTTIPNLTLTDLPTGNWIIMVSGDIRQTADALGTAQLYKNGVAVANTLRGLGSQASFGDDTVRQCLYIQAVVSSNGTDDFDVRWQDTTGSFTITDRSIIALRTS